MSRPKTLRFVSSEHKEFFNILRRRVDDYFRETGKSKYADWRMYVKIFAMLALFFAPYAIILSDIVNIWLEWMFAIIMGLGMAGIGLAFMHDANHGTVSRKQGLNKLIGFSLNLVGGHAYNWKLQHNVLHHSYTNVHEHDHDLDAGSILRFSPNAEYKWFHRFQFLYAPFLYCLLSLNWVLHKDFVQILQFKKMGLINKKQTNFATELSLIILTKVVYYGYILVLPLVLTDLLWWQWIIGFASLHFTCGLILSLVFQSAHVLDGLDFPDPKDTGIVENDWAVHQLRTTANFSRKNLFLRWYLGGLNFQVEHHLFPNISHLHYPKIADIVKETALEYGLPYNENRTFGNAIAAHMRTLRKLGKPATAPKVAMAS